MFFEHFFFNQKMNLSVRSSIISTAGANYTTLASGDDIGTGIVGHHRHHRAPPTPSLCTPSHVATSNDASSLLERFHSLSFTVCRWEGEKKEKAVITSTELMSSPLRMILFSLAYRVEVKWLRSTQMPPSLPGNWCCSFILPHSRILYVCACLHQNWLFPTLATTIMIGSQQNCYLLNLPALSSTVAHYLIGRLI